MNAIEYTIERLESEIKELKHEYKKLLKDDSNRSIHPYSEEGISDTLDLIVHKAFELKACNNCDRFLDCDHALLCIYSIDDSADLAKEYGDGCYKGALKRYLD